MPAIRPDVGIVHAQKADRAGNVMLEGIVGVQKEVVLASKRSIVTVEEIVDEFGARSPNAVILPAWTVGAIAEVPGGAYPSYAFGYYKRDNAFYKAWDAIARDRDGVPGLDEGQRAGAGPGGVRRARAQDAGGGGVMAMANKFQCHHRAAPKARVPVISLRRAPCIPNRDGRDKPGHDVEGLCL